MNCPSCALPLTPLATDDLVVEVCEAGCGGLWLSAAEFEKLDDPADPAAELLNVCSHRRPLLDPERPNGCPSCVGPIVMLRRFDNPKHEIAIDECGDCGGVWLLASGVRRTIGADEFFFDVVVPLLASEEAQTEADFERAQRFAHALRFACPSLYLRRTAS